jgi:acyl-CoA thioesterase
MQLIDYLNKYDRFAAADGVQLVEINEHGATAVMTVEKRHVNGANVCQGGAIFTLADLAFAAAVNQCGLMTVGTSNSITFLHSAVEGDRLTAVATVEDHHRMPFCEVRVTNQQGVLISVMTGSAYRRNIPLMTGVTEEG